MPYMADRSAWAPIALMPPHGLVDLGAVVTILGRQGHDGLVYFSRYGRHVREWLIGPFPPLIEGVFHGMILALGEEVRPALRQPYKRSALVLLPGAPPSANCASSIQSSASRSHAALSTSSVAVLALARHSSAFLRYRSASSTVMPYHARRANPFQAVSLFWSFRQSPSGEPVRAALRQLHERSAIVHFQPA